MFPIKRGFVKPYNQDTLDVWLLRDGINTVYDHKVKEVNEALFTLGYKGKGASAPSIVFEDSVGYLLGRVDRHIKVSGGYDFDSAPDLREELQNLVEDMDAVLTALGHEIEFGSGTYVINGS